MIGERSVVRARVRVRVRVRLKVKVRVRIRVKPSTGPPMLSMAVLPARTIRSPQESPSPCFSLIGSRRRRALSRFVLSSH